MTDRHSEDVVSTAYRHSDKVVPRLAYDELQARCASQDAEILYLRACRARARGGLLKPALLTVLLGLTLSPILALFAMGWTGARAAEGARETARLRAVREARAWARATEGRSVRQVTCAGPVCDRTGLRCHVTLEGDTHPLDLCCDTRDPAASDGCTLVPDPAFE